MIMLQGMRMAKRDQVTRYRMLWYICVFAIALAFIGIGGGYAFGGKDSAYSIKQYRILLSVFPGSLRAHGCILLGIGIMLFFSLGCIANGFTRGSWWIARFSLTAALVYSFWSTWALLGGWWINHHYTTLTFWYIATCLLSSAAVLLAPSFTQRTPQHGVA